jgi:hypothetical protein
MISAAAFNLASACGISWLVGLLFWEHKNETKK